MDDLSVNLTKTPILESSRSDRDAEYQWYKLDEEDNQQCDDIGLYIEQPLKTINEFEESLVVRDSERFWSDFSEFGGFRS